LKTNLYHARLFRASLITGAMEHEIGTCAFLSRKDPPTPKAPEGQAQIKKETCRIAAAHTTLSNRLSPRPDYYVREIKT